ncbi:hypothetical protein EDB86DRAFT_2828247 [Lactarius hatsudake]|nr:hypothetical protein EDB86DRAFT_2828247 [Lactarius hatsudake]
MARPPGPPSVGTNSVVMRTPGESALRCQWGTRRPAKRNPTRRAVKTEEMAARCVGNGRDAPFKGREDSQSIAQREPVGEEREGQEGAYVRINTTPVEFFNVIVRKSYSKAESACLLSRVCRDVLVPATPHFPPSARPIGTTIVQDERSLKFATAAVTAAARGGEVSGCQDCRVTMAQTKLLHELPRMVSTASTSQKSAMCNADREWIAELLECGGGAGGCYDPKGQPEEKLEGQVRHMSREWAQIHTRTPC